MEMLTVVECRVLGTLIEKSMATPEYYPLTLKGLQAGCNQATSRAPVTDYSETEIDGALKSLKLKGLSHYVEPQRGGTAWRYGHTLFEEHRWGLSRGQAALVAVLMLRGDQTTGELRQRVSALHIFPGLQQVEDSLQALTSTEDALVIALPKAAGQREFRWRFTRVDGSGEIPPEALQPADFHPDQSDSEMALPPRLYIARSEFEAMCERIRLLEERLAQLEALRELPGMDASKD
jgi:uncharacterized protein YceH (UPF0502 family)